MKVKELIASQKATFLLGLLGLYLVSAGTSWAVFSLLKGGSGESSPIMDTSELESARSKITELPKTEKCPINGKLFTKPEKTIWEGRRPITVMIENHVDSRPPEGLSKADVVYEAVAEGGITRFLGVFYCGVAGTEVEVAPVRSVRVYFIDWASEYGEYPIFMHVGGANDFGGFGDTVKEARALELLATIGWRVPKGNDFDTIYDSGVPVFRRNPGRLKSVGKEDIAVEHTMVANLDRAYEEAEKRGYGAKGSEGDSWDKSFISWTFSNEKPLSSPKVSEISFEFWSNKPEYEVKWTYNKDNNSYLRFNGEVKHTDLAFENTQITSKNVVIVFLTERGPVDRNKHMLYTTTGEGKALIYQNGDEGEATWKKKSRTDRTRFYDAKGKEINFVEGEIWIEAVPKGNKVNVK